MEKHKIIIPRDKIIQGCQNKN